MGRELRRVPANWQHPKRDGRYVPLYGGSWSAELAEWQRTAEAFAKGVTLDGSPLPSEANGCTFDEWHGSRPEHIDYMPDWPETVRTHFQMYETCSEGTPLTPVLESPEAVARWCAENGASAFGGMTQTYEWWLSVCKGYAGFGLMITPNGACPA